MLLLPLLNRFYRIYRWMLFLGSAANSQLVNSILFTAVIANLPLNLVLVGNLLFGRQLPLDALVLVLLSIFIQTAGTLIVVVQLTAISNCFYCYSDRLLYQVQLALTSNYSNFFTKTSKSRKDKLQHQWQHLFHDTTLLLAKLQLANFYETICTKKKFCFTFGPYTKVSYLSVFEFLFVNGGFILYTAKMVKIGKLQFY